MRQIFILTIMIVMGIGQLYAHEFTYVVSVPLDIDAIPNNQIVKDGRTYNIRYYRVQAYIFQESTGQVVGHLGTKVYPVSNAGIHIAVIVFSKTFNHKLNGDIYGASFSLCEDTGGNTCVTPRMSEIEEITHEVTGTLTKLK